MRNALHWIFWSIICSTILQISHAQQVLAPPPRDFAPQTNIIATLSGTEQIEEIPPQLAPEGAPSRRIWDFGPVHLHPHLLYSISYGDGIQSQPGSKSKTLINTIMPGMGADIGSHWHLDYTPTLRYYSSHDLKDELNHSVILNWGTAYEDWAWAASQSYVSSSTPLVDTASQTDTETYSTVASTAYQLNSKVSLSLVANQTIEFVENLSTNQPLSDSKNWSATAGFSYQIYPRLDAGATVGFAYDVISPGSDMTSERLQAHLNWLLGTKLKFAFRGGFEDRQFLESNTPDALNPIFGLSLVYNLFESTTFAFSADRTVSKSYFQNEFTEATGFTASLHQRLLTKLYLDITGGFTKSSYRATDTTLSVSREDNRGNINIRLSCPFLRHGTASVFYDWSDNSSTQNGFGYTSSQVGLELGYRF